MKLIDTELYEAMRDFADPAVRLAICMRPHDPNPRALRYLELREASGDPLPYKVVRDGDKVRFD